MHELVSYNREIIRSEDASMSPVAVSGLYGKGVFTTLTVLDGKPFLFEKHWRRLNNNATRLGIDLDDFSESELTLALSELLAANSVTRGRCRITVFDSSSSGIWLALTDRKSSVLIQSADLREKPERICLNISPFVVSSTSPLNNIKSCNYLEQTVSFDAACKAGFDEAVRINERGHIVSGCISNIFWTKDDRIFTPAVEMGCLEGTTRECLLESCEVSMVAAPISELRVADSVFLTSAGIGIAAASSLFIDEKELELKPLGDELREIQRLRKLLSV